MRGISHVLPPSYVFENLRAIVAGRDASLTDLGLASAIAIAELLLCAWVFARTHRNALRSGLIARCAADTVA